MNNAIKEHLNLINEYTQEISSTKSEKRRRDLKKCIKRLKNELSEYKRLNNKR